ncbi:MAG TPA: aldehyde:ferredoxin oxidoreductase, partial [candidate division Zixibacteria bacterium]|nr:aldehyde:ferredoxin oxidoreductase [candidate division Zixibacteria bacterium]
GLYPPETVSRALECCGFDMNADQLKALGKDVLRTKYAFKVREGFDPRAESLPERIFQTPAPGGAIDRGYVERAISAYRKELGL